jgi:WD40 repeat protein
LQPISGHNGWVSKLRWHPQNNIIYTADSWGQIRCTQLEQPSPKSKTLWAVKDAHDGWVRDISLSSDGEKLATCSKDKSVKIWDTKTGKNLFTHIAENDLFAVLLSESQTHILFGDLFGNITLWDYAKDQKIQEYDGSAFHNLHRLQDIAGLRTLQWSSNETQFVAAGCNPETGATVKSSPLIQIYETESGKLLHSHKPGENKYGYIDDIVQIPDHPKQHIIGITSGTPGTGKLFIVEPGNEDPIYENTKIPNPHSITLHPNKKIFAITSTNKGSNGNGRRLNKDGEYEGNNSPVQFFELVT